VSQHQLTDRLTEAASAAAAELARQDALSLAVLHTAESLLKNADWQTDVAHVLERLGRATQVSRVYVFENHTDETGRLRTSQRFEWAAAGVQPQLDNPGLQDLSLVEAGFERWEQVLGSGEVVEGPVAGFPEAERELLEAQDIRSLAVVPIFCDGAWWGFMGFDDCETERRWSETSLAVLGTAADLFGAAVFRLEAEKDRQRLGQERSARREALEAGERAAFMAEATSILTSSFDYQTTLARFARMAVPFLGDYCIVDILDGGLIRRIATAHADPAMQDVVRGLEAFPPKWGSNPIVRALRSGLSVMAGPEELTPEAISGEPEHQALLQELDPRHGIFTPIRSSARVIGVMSFCSCDPERDYGPEELSFAEDIATRAGMAIGNAQLFQEAQEAKRTRDEVLAVVAHDLRNPLGSIVGGAQMLEELVADGPAQQFIRIIRRSGDRMNRLIEDLLDASRVERGTLALHTSPVRLRALVGEATSMMRPLAKGRGIELAATTGDPEAHVLADAARILQVLSNLIGNALKFTPNGGRVELRATVDRGAALVEVEDTGPGIPAEEVPHLFDRFWQASAADRRGVGLGLSIARGIVEAHSGRIWVDSEPGRGSVFCFVLPLTDPPLPEPELPGVTVAAMA
jgi:signal transduction histidine kinase